MEKKRQNPVSAFFIIAIALVAVSSQVWGQLRHLTVRPPASNVIMPQTRARSFDPGKSGAIEIVKISALIDIIQSTATTTIEIQLRNTTNRRQEAELIFPVPDKVVVRGFAYDGPGGKITAEVLPKEDAKRIYQQLVAKIRDPALVEFVGYNLIRSSVFPVEANGKQKVCLTYEHLLDSDGNRVDYVPVEANGKQKVCLTYEHLLDSDGNRVDYVMPRTESLAYSVPWEIKANISAKHQ